MRGGGDGRGGRLLRRLLGPSAPRVSEETARLFSNVSDPLRASHSTGDLNTREKRRHEFYRISRRHIVDAALQGHDKATRARRRSKERHATEKESDESGPSDEGIELCDRQRTSDIAASVNQDGDDHQVNNKSDDNNNTNNKSDDEKKRMEAADKTEAAAAASAAKATMMTMMRSGLVMTAHAWVPAMFLSPESSGWSLQCDSCKKNCDMIKESNSREPPLGRHGAEVVKSLPEPDYDNDCDDDQMLWPMLDEEIKGRGRNDECLQLAPFAHLPRLPTRRVDNCKWKSRKKTTTTNKERRAASLETSAVDRACDRGAQRRRKSSAVGHMCVTEDNFPELVSALQAFLMPSNENLSETDSLDNDDEESVSLKLQQEVAVNHCYVASRGQREREQEVCEVTPQQIQLQSTKAITNQSTMTPKQKVIK